MNLIEGVRRLQVDRVIQLIIDRFNEVFKVPKAMRQYIHLVVQPLEMDLILAMNGETLPVAAVAERMG